MIKILANDGIHSDGKLLLEDAGYQVDTDKIPQNELVNHLPDYDAVIVRSATKIRKDLIDACPNLKIIARAGVGLDNIDSEYARSKNIAVYNTPAASSHSVAELAFAHIFNLARHLHQSNREMPVKGNTEFKALKKSYSTGFELRGKTLGILGFGRIGQAVARVGMGLGMRILPVDLYVEDATISVEMFSTEMTSVSAKMHTVSMEQMLKESDVISIHIPFSGDEALIKKEELSQMKNSAILINASRGGIIDEQDLLDALENGTIAGAALDVFDNEPTPRAELLNHSRISVSPHIGASTIEAQENIGKELADKIIAFFENT